MTGRMDSISKIPLRRVEFPLFMYQLNLPQVLVAALGRLSQKRATGILVLEQNDGCRRIEWLNGEVVHLQSDVAGEQFGGLLLRQGIMDFATLNQLLSEYGENRIGERAVAMGLLTASARDEKLSALLHFLMVHVLEHPLVCLEWVPEWRGEATKGGSPIAHPRAFLWHALQQANMEDDLYGVLTSHSDWQWTTQLSLMDRLSDFPLTPQMAFASSLLGVQPMGFDTFLSLCGMAEGEAAKFIGSLWALGLLDLAVGEVPCFAPDSGIIGRWEGGQAVPTPTPAEASRTAIVETGPLTTAEPHQEGPSAPSALDDLVWQDLVADQDAPSSVPTGVAENVSEVSSPSPLVKPTLEGEGLKAQSESHLEKAERGYLYAKALLAQEKVGEAIAALEESVEWYGDGPEGFDAWMLLGRQRMITPALSQRAVEAFQRASRLQPTLAEPWALIGEIYRRRGLEANATGCFKKALSLDPSVAVPPDVSSGDQLQALRPSKTSLLSRFKFMVNGKSTS